MEKQKLLDEYKQCIEAIAKKFVATGIIDKKLRTRADELLLSIRNCDIVESIISEEKKSNMNIFEIPISKEDYIEPIPNINKISKDVYYDFLKSNTVAANSNNNVAHPGCRTQDFIEDYIARMTSLQAAEITQETAAEPDYFGGNRPR